MLISFLKKQSGISLIELLIAFSILSIVAIFSFPMLKYFYESTQDKILQSQLLHLIQQGRTGALTFNAPVILCNSHDYRKCSNNLSDGYILFIDEADDHCIHDPKQLLATLPPLHHGKLWWRSFPFYRPYLLFSPSHLTSNDNATFWYCRSNKKFPTWAITVNDAGVSRLIKMDNQNNLYDRKRRLLKCAYD